MENTGFEIEDDFLIALGMYVVTTATCESVFLAILRLAIGRDDDTSMIAWVQTQSTRARLEMVRNTFRAAFPGQDWALAQVSDFARRFRGHTRQRNFLCHAAYGPSPNGQVHATGYEIVDGNEVIKQTEKRITKGTVNEINQAIREIEKLSDEMWEFIQLFQEALVAVGWLQAPIVDIP